MASSVLVTKNKRQIKDETYIVSHYVLLSVETAGIQGSLLALCRDESRERLKK
jgi:hypothetical protein